MKNIMELYLLPHTRRSTWVWIGSDQGHLVRVAEKDVIDDIFSTDKMEVTGVTHNYVQDHRF